MRGFLTILCLLTVGFAWAQPCTNATEQVLCADAGPSIDSLQSTPFQVDCFDFPYTNFYTFHTGTDPNNYAVLRLTYEDCDNFLGNDSITLIVAELNGLNDPCNPSSYNVVSPCITTTQSVDTAVVGLLPDHDYIVVMGSNHDPLFGVCSYSLEIGGPAVDISATCSPAEIFLGQGISAYAFGASPGAAYSWSPEPPNANYTADSALTFYPDELGNQVFSAVSTIGECTVVSPIYIQVDDPLNIYNALTPNGDVINDTWEIYGINRPEFEAAEVSVYDRWGQLVYRSLGYQTPWDGTNRGKYLPTAAYYYVIELNCYNVYIKPYTGIVSILR